MNFSQQPTRTGQDFINIVLLDSDMDGFINIDEIHNMTFPGNASDFPLIMTLNGSIAGMKFNDMNNNGTKDEGETGIANWQINLTNSEGSITSMMTDGTGNYNFTDLPAGTYLISETSKEGWTQTFPASPGNYSVTLVIFPL